MARFPKFTNQCPMYDYDCPRGACNPQHCADVFLAGVSRLEENLKERDTMRGIKKSVVIEEADKLRKELSNA